MTMPTNVDVYGWRWGSDVSDANSPSFLAGAEASYEVPQASLDTALFLYIGIENDGGSVTENYQLQCDVDAAGYGDVNASSSNVRSAAGADTDGDAITGLPSGFTAGVGTFENGQYEEGDGLASSQSVSEAFYTVLVFAIQFRSADLSGGESINFRLSGSSSGVLTLDVTPNATIEAAAGEPVTAWDTPPILIHRVR